MKPRKIKPRVLADAATVKNLAAVRVAAEGVIFSRINLRLARNRGTGIGAAQFILIEKLDALERALKETL